MKNDLNHYIINNFLKIIMNISSILLTATIYYYYGYYKSLCIFFILILSSLVSWAPDIFIDDSKKNLDRVSKKRPYSIIIYCKNHSSYKRLSKKDWLKTSETFKTWYKDGLLYQAYPLIKLFVFCLIFWMLQQKPTIYLDIDKCFDGWISFDKNKKYSLIDMQFKYEDQGLIYDSWQFYFTKMRMIYFLKVLWYLNTDVIFWTENNFHNTRNRFEYWEISTLIQKLGFISLCAGPGNSKIVMTVGF